MEQKTQHTCETIALAHILHKEKQGARDQEAPNTSSRTRLGQLEPKLWRTCKQER
jgi:hypothetical protein